MNEVNNIKGKALKSAQWMVITSIVSMLFSYLTNILLGKISPEMLGTYSAVNVFIASLSTFVGMGGAIVLSNFLPKIESDEKKSQLLFTYTLMSFGMYVILVAAILLFPELNTVISGGMEGVPKYIALFIMAPVHIIMMVISYLLIAMLEARISNIMSKFYTCLLPIVLLAVYVIDENLIEQYLTLIVFFSVIASNIMAIVLGFSFIKRKKILVKSFEIYVPKGFLGFSFTTFCQAILSFLYKNADKMFLISLGDMGQLGYYQAIISIVALIEFVPSLMGNVTIPYFSNIIRLGDKNEVAVSYERIEKYMLFFLVSCVLGVIALSDIGLGVFGKDYLDYKYLLIILAIAQCISALNFTNTPMMIVLERNWVRLFNSVMQIAVQFAITFLTINKIGILGVVLGRAIGLCLAQIWPQLIIKYKSGYTIKISRSYFVGTAIAIIFCLLSVLLRLNLLLSIAAGIVLWLLFLLLGGYKKSDYISMLNMILKRKA